MAHSPSSWRSDGSPPPVDVVGRGSNALDLLGVIDGHPVLRHQVAAPAVRGAGRRDDRDGDGGVRAARSNRSHIGKFGDDYWARLGRRLLARDGVDVRWALRARGSAGHVSIMLIDAQPALRTGFYRRPPAYYIRP